MTNEIFIPNLTDLIESYNSGVSMKQLSNNFHIERGVLTRRFIKAGVNIRGRSDAEKLKWSQMPLSKRKTQVEKAHQAVRGSHHSIETKMKAAKSFYQACLRSGMFESEIAEILNNYFIIERQAPIWIYNVDLLIHKPPVAIEIQCSNHHMIYKPKIRKRAKYICGKGFLLIYVILDPRYNIEICRIANKLISFCKSASRDKSIRGKYIMIGGDGEAFPSTRYNFYNLTRII